MPQDAALVSITIELTISGPAKLVNVDNFNADSVVEAALDGLYGLDDSVKITGRLIAAKDAP